MEEDALTIINVIADIAMMKPKNAKADWNWKVALLIPIATMD